MNPGIAGRTALAHHVVRFRLEDQIADARENVLDTCVERSTWRWKPRKSVFQAFAWVPILVIFRIGVRDKCNYRARRP